MRRRNFCAFHDLGMYRDTPDLDTPIMAAISAPVFHRSPGGESNDAMSDCSDRIASSQSDSVMVFDGMA